jgi:enoyl-CoA hydratase
MDFSELFFMQEDAVGIITINRPKALNALSSLLLAELESVMAHLENCSEIKAIIITGSGEKAFVAGADITQMKMMHTMQAKEFAEKGQRVFMAIEQCAKPVIAAVNGFALGGGCELAMACDFCIAAETAKFGQPEAGLGIVPGFGGTQRLPRLVGQGMAKMLIYTGNIIDAQEAYRIGLVQKVTKPENLLIEARRIAGEITGKSEIAVAFAKEAINRGCNMSIADGLGFEATVFGTCFSCKDQREGMSAFLEKRKALFTGEFFKE